MGPDPGGDIEKKIPVSAWNGPRRPRDPQNRARTDIWTNFFQVSSDSIVIGPFSRCFSVRGVGGRPGGSRGAQGAQKSGFWNFLPPTVRRALDIIRPGEIRVYMGPPPPHPPNHPIWPPTAPGPPPEMCGSSGGTDPPYSRRNPL